MSLAALSVLEIVDELARRKKRRGQIHDLFPDEGPLRRDLYPRHIDFFSAGAPEGVMSRLAMCANGVGKTYSMGGYEIALHVTGLYPDWWPGYRFKKPPRFWIAGKTRQTTRDNQQKILLGRPNNESEGGGLIPTDLIDIDSIRRWPGAGGLIESVRIKHVSGGWSELGSRSYDQELDAWFGENLDGGWMDEPAPILHYAELAARTRGSERPMMLVTFTPKHGLTDLIKLFIEDPDPSRRVISCTWDDVPHLTEDWKRATLANTPPYMRETVCKGVPALGVGAVFPIPESDFVIPPLAEIPAHWPRVFGFDGGWHNTAAVWGAWDRDSDCWYLYSEHKVHQQLIPVIAAAIKARGAWIPGLGDIYGADQTDGTKVRREYLDTGVNIHPAKKPGKEARIENFRLGLANGRIKVFSTLTKFLDEYRTYHYDDQGRLVKQNDHLLDAAMHLYDEGRRYAKTQSQAKAAPAFVPERRFGRAI